LMAAAVLGSSGAACRRPHQVSSRCRGAVAASAAADLIVSVSWLMVFVLRPSVSRRAFFHWPLVTSPSPGMVLRAQPLGCVLGVDRPSPMRRLGNPRIRSRYLARHDSDVGSKITIGCIGRPT